MSIVELKSNEFNMVHGGDFKHMLTGCGIMAPIAFFMGVPMPLGLSRYAGRSNLSPQSLGALGNNPIFAAALIVVSIVGFTEIGYGGGRYS